MIWKKYMLHSTWNAICAASRHNGHQRGSYADEAISQGVLVGSLLLQMEREWRYRHFGEGIIGHAERCKRPGRSKALVRHRDE
jgi:hypothetical protein